MMQTVMRHFSAFVILAGMSAMAGMAKASTSDGRKVLTGAAASEMIRMTLAEQNPVANRQLQTNVCFLTVKAV